MSDYESHLTRWQSAGVLDPAQAARIRAFEAERKQPAGLQWQVLVALILGAILLFAGVALFVNAHWDQLSALSRYALVLAMVAVFHLGAAFSRPRFPALATTLSAVGTLSTGAAIALVGQIFNIQEHWPAAILMWAIAAAAGWFLLKDQAQQTMTLLLVPAWLLCEWAVRAEDLKGEYVYFARILVTWALLYLTLFLDSSRRITRGVLFAFSAIALIVGTIMLTAGWEDWRQPLIHPALRIAGWALVLVPLALALLRPRLALVPVAVGLAASILLPFCQTNITNHDYNYTHSGPNLIAHLLVTALAVFLGWWGVRTNSKALANYGVLGFAISVGWFYFTDLFDKLGRSLGLIGLGLLFLGGGWLLERTRRRIIAQINDARATHSAPAEETL
jgi:uncharacterized membrane protein